MNEISADILKRASAGDVNSFELIYKEMADFVYNVALRLVNNNEDAEEVTQEVFITVYNKLKYFRFESSIKTWIYRITVNRAINLAKKRSREKMKIAEYEKEFYSAVETKPGKERNDGMLEALLKSVDLDQRACLVLRNVEGLSYKEISDALKININTVRSRLRRAREKLLALRKVRMV
jgi:RNA polymerase sigma-70 factor (ECF subfamily)